MIDRRLVIGQPVKDFKFSWMNEEFKKYFKEVVVMWSHCYDTKEDDVILGNCCLGSFQNLKCHRRFGIMLPGFSFHPFKHPEWVKTWDPILAKYDAIFCDEAPVGLCMKRDSSYKNFHIVPICCNSHTYRKTRKRDQFKRIIQVASTNLEKGRDVSEKAMRLMPYDWELFPRATQPYGTIPESDMPGIYQNADGFLHPGRIGPSSPDPIWSDWVDAKYTVSLIEAAMSGCIIFWHDAMGIGNSMETVFEVSLKPLEIAQRIQEVVKSIDLDKHSTRTSEEFRNKYSIENTVKQKMKIIEQYM